MMRVCATPPGGGVGAGARKFCFRNVMVVDRVPLGLCVAREPSKRIRAVGSRTRGLRKRADWDDLRAPLLLVSEDEILDHREILKGLYYSDTEAELRKSPGDLDEPHLSAAREIDDESREASGLDVPSSWWMQLRSSMNFSPRVRGIILLNVLAFLYGTNVSVIKSAEVLVDPSLFTVGRFAIAGLAFTPFLRSAVTRKEVRTASIELGILASVGYLTQAVSLLTSDAARVSFISTFTVIVVPLLAGLSGAKIPKVTWAAATVALLGVGLLESSGGPLVMGDAWSFVSAVLFGIHMLRSEHYSRSLAAQDSMPVISLQLVAITICSALWSCAAHYSAGDLVLDLQRWNSTALWHELANVPWPAMLYTGLLSTAFCLWIELASMRDVTASEAAVIYTLEPLWGAAFAWFLMGERWGPRGWLGALLILGGSLSMQLFGRPTATVLESKALSAELESTRQLHVDDESEASAELEEFETEIDEEIEETKLVVSTILKRSIDCHRSISSRW